MQNKSGRVSYMISKIKKQMLRGESNWRSSKESVFALKWMVKKTVVFLSNIHNPQDTLFA